MLLLLFALVMFASCLALFAWSQQARVIAAGPFTSANEFRHASCFEGAMIDRVTFFNSATSRRFELSVPSPHDTMYQWWGEFGLSSQSVDAFRTNYTWVETERHAMPKVAQKLLPPGDRFMVCSEFSDDTGGGPSRCWNGYVVVDPAVGWDTVYFVFRDDDHWIEEEFPRPFWK